MVGLYNQLKHYKKGFILLDLTKKGPTHQKQNQFVHFSLRKNYIAAWFPMIAVLNDIIPMSKKLSGFLEMGLVTITKYQGHSLKIVI